VGAFFGDVPVTERYYSGGTGGQRGFADRRLSPLVCAHDAMDKQHCVVIGGDRLVETGVELRHRIGTVASLPVGANLFLDGANVKRSPQQLALSNLYWAAGAGLWSKVVGDLKIRFDIGFRLNRTDSPDPLAPSSDWDYFQVNLGVG